MKNTIINYLIFAEKNPKEKGFTLIELLIVIAIMAILTTVVFVALNPLARFQDARNNRRWQDVNAIISAIKLHQVDNKGIYLDTIANDMSDDTYYQIGDGSSCADTCSNPTVTLQTECIDLTDLVDGGYLPSVPYDEQGGGSSAETRYYILKSSTGTLLVGSCSEEIGSEDSIPDISVQR